MTYNATEIRDEAEATLREAMLLYAHANRLVTTTKPPREGSQRARILAALATEPMTTRVCIERFPHAAQYLARLRDDGLVICVSGVWEACPSLHR